MMTGVVRCPGGTFCRLIRGLSPRAQGGRRGREEEGRGRPQDRPSTRPPPHPIGRVTMRHLMAGRQWRQPVCCCSVEMLRRAPIHRVFMPLTLPLLAAAATAVHVGARRLAPPPTLRDTGVDDGGGGQ